MMKLLLSFFALLAVAIAAPAPEPLNLLPAGTYPAYPAYPAPAYNYPLPGTPIAYSPYAAYPAYGPLYNKIY